MVHPCCMDNSLTASYSNSIGYSLKCPIPFPSWGHKLYSQTLLLPVLSDNQRNHHIAGKKKKSFYNYYCCCKEKAFNFHPCPTQKLLRCSSQVWVAVLITGCLNITFLPQTATFCCRQIELFSYKYSRCFNNVLITNLKGYLTGLLFFFSPTSKSSEWPPCFR